MLDPIDGWIVTANNAVVDAGYPRFIGQEWDPGYRAERIIDLINDHAQDGLTVPEMGLIQTDTAPLRARDVVLWLDPALPDTADGFTIADRIATWDGRCTLDSTGCAAYMAWEYRILRDVFALLMQTLVRVTDRLHHQVAPHRAARGKLVFPDLCPGQVNEVHALGHHQQVARRIGHGAQFMARYT